jgi:hypothetical protein
MYVGGLIPYLRDTQDQWYLKSFTEEARGNHQSSVWDPIAKQVSSTSDVWIRNALALDDVLNFTDTPTTSWTNSAQLHFDMPDVTMAGETPSMYHDQDSVSTLQPNGRHNSYHNQHSPAEERKEDQSAHEASQHQENIDRNETTQDEESLAQTNTARQDISSL